VEAEYRCPICHEGLTRHDHALCCVNHHTFNIARQGYVDLSRKQKASGDNRTMVQARTRFLEQGYYRFLRDADCYQHFFDICGVDHSAEYAGSSDREGDGLHIGCYYVRTAGGADGIWILVR